MRRIIPTTISLWTALLACAVALVTAACSEKIEPNRVDLDQIEHDESTNYQSLFKDAMEKEKDRSRRYHRDEF
jgi:hypothetical protein